MPALKPSENTAQKIKSVKVPKIVFDREDVQLLQERYGCLRDGGEFYVFTTEQFEGLLKLIDENKYLNLSEATDRGFSIRIAAKLMSLSGQAHSVADKAAILACIVGIFQIDQELAIRLLTIVK